MSKTSRGILALPESMKSSLCVVGQNIQIARKRRRIPLRQMSERTLVSVPTIRKVEAGDPSVSIGIFLQILWVLQLHTDFEKIADPTKDVLGNYEELKRLPKKIHAEKSEIDLNF